MENKIVVIGAGNVGMSYVYSLVNQSVNVSEIDIIDLDEERIKGEALDLNHGIPFSPNKVKIKAGTYDDCASAKLVVICAGANQEPGETRLDLLSKNDRIFKIITEKVVASGFDGIFLIATNPVDIMTYSVLKHSGFPPSKVIGSGTTLDTARLKYLIGKTLNINTKNVHAYVMGEHGDSEFVLWSTCTVGGVHVSKFIDEENRLKIAASVKNAAYDIIKLKGSTHYAIGQVLTRITKAIIDDERTVLTVSSYHKDLDIYIGMPSIVGKDGVAGKINVGFNKEEKEKFINSAYIIKSACLKISE